MFPVTELALNFNFYLSTSVEARVPSDMLLLMFFLWMKPSFVYSSALNSGVFIFTQGTGSWSLRKRLNIFDCKASLQAAFK